MTSCEDEVKIIKGLVNDQNNSIVKMIGILSLFKKKTSPMNSKNSREESQIRERAKSCPRAEQRMKIIGEYGRIYTRTLRFALLSPLWLSSYKKKVSLQKRQKERSPAYLKS